MIFPVLFLLFPFFLLIFAPKVKGDLLLFLVEILSPPITFFY